MMGNMKMNDRNHIQTATRRQSAPTLRLHPSTDSGGNWIDAQGRAVPPRYIAPNVRNRDRLVRRVVAKANRLQQQMADVKTDILTLVDDYLEDLAERYDETWKGNAELLSFDGRLKVDVKVSEALEFDERLQVAKQKIDACLRRWTGRAPAELKAIVHQAFQMDSKGRINVRSILTLRQLRFEDPVWNEAMDLIADSLRVRHTRRYVNIYRKDPASGRFELLVLNWSALGPRDKRRTATGKE
jgi:hypothetical protein